MIQTPAVRHAGRRRGGSNLEASTCTSIRVVRPPFLVCAHTKRGAIDPAHHEVTAPGRCCDTLDMYPRPMLRGIGCRTHRVRKAYEERDHTASVVRAAAAGHRQAGSHRGFPSTPIIRSPSLRVWPTSTTTFMPRFYVKAFPRRMRSIGWTELVAPAGAHASPLRPAPSPRAWSISIECSNDNGCSWWRSSFAAELVDELGQLGRQILIACISARGHERQVGLDALDVDVGVDQAEAHGINAIL